MGLCALLKAIYKIPYWQGHFEWITRVQNQMTFNQTHTEDLNLQHFHFMHWFSLRLEHF